MVAMMLETQIKPDYSKEVAQFLANGGQIQQAVNTNKAEFNYYNADTVLQSAERPNSYQNHILRTRAEKQGLKSYKPVALCKSCGTSERSVKTNACLECDRRRARAKMTINESKIIQIGLTLLTQEKTITFTQSGKKYVLKVEEI